MVHCLFDMYKLWLFKELKVAVKPVSTFKISIAWYKQNFPSIFPYLIVGLPQGVTLVFTMVLYTLLLAEALCVIIKHKSISTFEIINSDFGVKLAMAWLFYKAEASRSLDVH